jgi:hypothetical protein
MFQFLNIYFKEAVIPNRHGMKEATEAMVPSG